MPEAISHRVSGRAKRVWKRLSEFYGARMTEQFGAIPPKPWCDAIDAATDAAVQMALVKIRATHLQFPPTLPEFEAALRAAETPQEAAKPDLRTQLVDWIVRNKPLTPLQRARPWTWLGRTFDAPGPDGKMRKDYGVEFTGVLIPADGEHPGYRVMFEDMQLNEVAA